MRLYEAFIRDLEDVSREDIKRFIETNRDPEFKGVDLDEYENAMHRLRYEVGTFIRAYRAISIMGDIEQELRKDNIGTSWTYDVSAAKTYKDEHRGYGETYILVTTLNGSEVDWLKTVALNMIPVRGKFESELRLFPNKPIKIHRIINLDGAPPVNPKGFTVKLFMS